MKILVTGGTGYIGSHTAVELLNNDYEVVIIDNLSNSKREVVDKIKKITGKDVIFYEGDVCDKKLLEEIFNDNKSVKAAKNIIIEDIRKYLEEMINIPPHIWIEGNIDEKEIRGIINKSSFGKRFNNS